MNISAEKAGDSRAVESGRKIKTILAPINVAGGPNDALEFAVELARFWRAKLYVLFVYSPLPQVSASKLMYVGPSVDRERGRLLIKLLDLTTNLQERHAETFALFTDSDCPAESIQKTGRQLNADLIVVSTHATGWLARMLLYSDSDDIARRSSIPVLVYRSKLRPKTE
jgi:nucleotide-binding universal stress UspA family protein